MSTEAAKRAKEKWRKKNPSYRRDHYIKCKKGNPEKHLWSAAHQRAIKKSLPFNIEVADIIIPTHCPILGMEMANHIGEGSAQNNSPSIDRIIPELGYTKGNIQIISHKANVMKANATPVELLIFAKYILEKYNGD